VLKDETQQWGKIADQVHETRQKLGHMNKMGNLRSELAVSPV
jgi:hypothetical protein